MARFHRRLLLFLGLALSALFLSACAPEFEARLTPEPEAGVYPVDVVFREFYRALGGVEVLGPAISGPVQKDGSLCQYTANVLMCYDANAGEMDHLQLYPLGKQMGQRDDPQVLIQPGNSRAIDGYVIYDEFVYLYDKLRGARYAGHPLTQVRFNYQQNRIEQYFENVGFYRDMNQPRGQVHLIAYGSASCLEECQYDPPPTGAVIGGQSVVEQPFLIPILRMGGIPIFGQPLSRPYIAKDGNLEQVYEKAVFYAPRGQLNHLNLRKVPLILGVAFSLPSQRINDSRMVFYPIANGLGFNVPGVFDRFIAGHGSKEISGQPISEITKVEGQNLYRQCFENYCLDYDPNATNGMNIHLSPIGERYLASIGRSDQMVPRFAFSPENVILKIGENQEITTKDPQEFYLVVMQQTDQRPLANIEAEVTVALPNGRTVKAHFQPTGVDGRSSVTIPPQKSIPNGSVVPYRVCLNVVSEQPICADETYLVWDNR